MSFDESKRSRHVRKKISFNSNEWERVQRRMEIAGSKSFESFARSAILDSEIKVTKIPFDPSVLRVELSRIGNNINQIARQVNVEEVVTYEEMRAARLLLKEVQHAINQAVKDAQGK